MITPKALRDAAAEKISKISSAKIYENTVIESFKAPCLFIETPSFDCSVFKDGTAEVTATVQITYFPPIQTGERVRSDKSTFSMMAKFSKEFFKFEVEDRVFTSGEIKFSFLGENTDVLQTNIELNFFDDIDVEEEEKDLISEIKIKE